MLTDIGQRRERLAIPGEAYAAFAILALLIAVPLFAGNAAVDKLTTLFVYLLLAVMWNLLAGYAGIVSVGQQAFFGLGGYFAVRLVEAGLPPYWAFFVGALGVAIVAIPISAAILRLKGGELAIALWVLAEVLRLAVMFDPLVQGETGISLLAMNSFDPTFRRNLNYWLGLAAVSGMLVAAYFLLRSKIGLSAKAIRDDEEAAKSIGIDAMRVKQVFFVIAAFGCAIAGMIWLANTITYQPRTNFGIQWTVFMLFMVLVGGLGTFAGPIVGAVVFFLLQEIFGNYGAWYLAGLGLIAILFASMLPGGIMGYVQSKTGFVPFSDGMTQNNRKRP
ncbi:branched-chain amino acid ABC transporter permease [Pelagibacterium limicola]|uniref:branched-chain amino acid ABC transporter permease n=1 Tax=Pelagibacterium limicola TaxID=2791022 RepID=UPI0018AFE433|nr:branched-chain amino acid ABC transporter permease [Pelagibacterium limicola]